MPTTLERFTSAAEEFGKKVRQIKDDQWGDPTPCTEWNVRALVNHLVYELRWAVPLLQGTTIADVGDQFENKDLLGEDPEVTWAEAQAAAIAAASAPQALEGSVHLSYGDRAGDYYVAEVTTDLIVHGWDLAKGIRADTSIDDETAAWAYGDLAPKLSGGRMGAFAPEVAVAEGADPASKLIAFTGRDPAWGR